MFHNIHLIPSDIAIIIQDIHSVHKWLIWYFRKLTSYPRTLVCYFRVFTLKTSQDISRHLTCYSSKILCMPRILVWYSSILYISGYRLIVWDIYTKIWIRYSRISMIFWNIASIISWDIVQFPGILTGYLGYGSSILRIKLAQYARKWRQNEQMSI